MKKLLTLVVLLGLTSCASAPKTSTPKVAATATPTPTPSPTITTAPVAVPAQNVSTPRIQKCPYWPHMVWVNEADASKVADILVKSKTGEEAAHCELVQGQESEAAPIKETGVMLSIPKGQFKLVVQRLKDAGYKVQSEPVG